MGRIVIDILSSLYCKATSGNAHLLSKVNQVLIGMYKLRARIDGSAPVVFVVYTADGYALERAYALAGSFTSGQLPVMSLNSFFFSAV